MRFATFVMLSHLECVEAQTNAVWRGGTGNWSNALLWQPMTVPNDATFNVLLDNGNALNSVVSLDISVTIGGLTIDAGDVLRMNNGVNLVLSNAAVQNAGVLSLNTGGAPTTLMIAGTVSLQGAGKVTLGSVGGNSIRFNSAPATDTLNSFQTIEGKGDIDVIFNNGAGGIVDANVSGQSLTLYRATTKAGTLRARNGATLLLNGITVANTGALLEAQAGSTVNLNGSTLIATGGGNLIATGGGNLIATGGGNLIATGGGNLIATGGGNVVAGVGGNVTAGAGGNVTATTGPGVASSSASGLAGETVASAAASFTSPIILAQSGGNLMGLTGGTFNGNMVAESGGSVLPGNAGVIGTMTLNGGLDLQAGSILKMDILSKVQGSG